MEEYVRNFGTSVLLPLAPKKRAFLVISPCHQPGVSSYPYVPMKIQGPSIPMGRDAAPANMTLIALQAPVTISVQVGKITPVVGV